MKNVVKPGDRKKIVKKVQIEDLAAFQGTVVHPVYATFSLARDVEWTTRQFIIDMCDDTEEGIGTFLSIDHRSSALLDEEVVITAWVDQLNDNELICFFEAKVDDRLVAIGRTGQKILKKEKIDLIFKKHEQ
jgi:fluoroacetyl-CoA thioesterase